ncbi:MAG: GTPase HflX [SAR324 cluster bacterium]|jgi:GTP-binding protein HflX|nr:GTPase HflX [SAR324 cluster bacterium]MDP7170303.1 GTPase HflX [SAR324 cluster bacterium]MDP7175178.1 GTPase HflX [SAR324 cluster bacterium]|tara:strand:- start:522 stop:1829 length:1308 start_codon:yes stop_codon:yes gene_type:complete
MDENRLFNNWQRALIVTLQLPHKSNAEVQSSLEEMSSLTYSLGGEVAGKIVQARSQIHPAYFFGKGKLDEIKLTLKNEAVDALLVDNQLSPKQTQNLEKILECEVLDRTQVILEIFAKNARTREAKLQIGLAQAEYLLPRLVGLWKHLDRERGGIGASRGTGEKQIEKDRQFLRQRITRFKAQLERVDKERNTQKQRRSNCLQVSLIGYTNAGKSTIMNALTNSGLLVEDRLFATLDSTTRLLEEDTRPKVLLSDTVGFISNLPHEVVAAFRSTLSTVKDADLLLEIVDASNNIDEHLQTTADVLEDLDSLSIPIIKVFNKIDRISPTRLLMLEKMYPEAVFVSVKNSAENGHDNSSSLVDIIRKKILHFFDERMKTVTIRLDYLHSQQLANIYEWSRVDNIDYQEGGIMMTLTTIPGNLERLRHHLGSGFTEMS